MTTYLIQLLFGATVLLTIGAIASLILCRAAASLRYHIWTFTLLGLILTPLLTPLLPKTHLAGTRRPSPPQTMTPPPVIPDPGSTVQRVDTPVVVLNEPTTILETPKFTIRYDYVLPAVWLFGTAVLLVHLLVSIRGVRKMLTPLESASDSVLDELRRELGIKRSVRLIRGQTGTVPFICGVFRPTIVLPPRSESWTAAERRAVLTHELAHVARNDLFWQIVTQIVCAIYWFHPLVWFAAYRIWVERESACDDTVVLRGEKPSVYADVLLELANGLRKQKPALLGCTVAITRKNKVGKRIQAILNPNLRRTPLGKIGTAVFLVAAISAIISIATLSPFAKTEKEKSNSAKETEIFGRVVDMQGKPIEDAVVDVTLFLFSPGRTDTPMSPPGASWGLSSDRAKTDADGRYSFLVPSAFSFATAAALTQEEKGTHLVSDAVMFAVEGTKIEKNFSLKEGTLVSGTVKDSTGGAAVNSRVWFSETWKTPNEFIDEKLNPHDFNELVLHLSFDRAAYTDEKGKYVIYLPEGDYKAGALLGREMSPSNQLCTVEQGRTQKMDFALVTLDDLENIMSKTEAKEPVRFSASQDRETPEPAEISGRVTDTTGKPVPDATVMIYMMRPYGKRSDGSPMWGTSAQLPKTDAEGKYTASVNKNDIITCQAYLSDKDGKPTPLVSSVAIFPCEKTNLTQNFTLEEGGHVSGTLRTREGQVVKNGIVSFCQSWPIPDELAGNPRNDSTANFGRSATTDENGRYDIYLPPGDYQVVSYGKVGDNVLNEDIETHTLRRGENPVIDLVLKVVRE